MPRIVGNSVPERKSCLADLVVEHLSAKKLDGRAEVLRNRTNTDGHTDQVVVSSPRFGLIHVMAIGGIRPNDTIPFQGEGADQRWLAEKSLVAFGWNTDDGRTLIFFLDADSVRENPPEDKPAVAVRAKGELTAVLR